MKYRITKDDLVSGFKALGVACGDTVLLRANLGVIGRMTGLADAFIEAFFDVVGEEGTLVSLAFTKSYFIRRPDPNSPFRLNTPTYAGSLPRKMLELSQAKRSQHPNCSYVALGKNAELITSDHGPESPAYEPVRKIIDFRGKMILVGCVSSSPGFTTTHLAEYDLGMMKRIIFPWLNTCYYENEEGNMKLFRRKDLGFCSNSFYKFYSHYVNSGILRSGFIGGAYSIMVPAKEAYDIEKDILTKNPKFNICSNPNCFICNARRWDRLHKMPLFIARFFLNKVLRKK